MILQKIQAAIVGGGLNKFRIGRCLMVYRALRVLGGLGAGGVTLERDFRPWQVANADE